MGLLLAKVDLLDLGVSEGTDNLAVPVVQAVVSELCARHRSKGVDLLGDLVTLGSDGSTFVLGVLGLVVLEGTLGLGLVPAGRNISVVCSLDYATRDAHQFL